MRSVVLAIGLIVAVSACGSTDGAESTDATTSTDANAWTQAAEGTGELRANQPLTDNEQRAQAIEQREQEEFVDACTEQVPALAFLDVKQAKAMWKKAKQKETALRQACTEIAETAPEQRATLEDSITKAAKFLESNEATAAGAPTTTTDPAKPQITISCPPKETNTEQAFRAEFDVETASRADIVEWWIDYGEGNSYRAVSESSAQNELYWHYYYSPGEFEVTAWIIDEKDKRAEATCTVRWSP